MSENCNQNCSSCGMDCGDRTEEQNDFSVKLHEFSKVKKVIGVVSGKGGVGKSLVTSLLAVTMNRAGYRTAILDADITGPSIPKSFGLTRKAKAVDSVMIPVQTESGIDIMSINLILEDDTDPVVWRGPVLAGVVQQFWGDTFGMRLILCSLICPRNWRCASDRFQSLPVDASS